MEQKARKKPIPVELVERAAAMPPETSEAPETSTTSKDTDKYASQNKYLHHLKSENAMTNRLRLERDLINAAIDYQKIRDRFEKQQRDNLPLMDRFNQVEARLCDVSRQ